MHRFLAPAVCFGLAAYILWGIGGDGPVLVFVGLERFVGPQPEAQARLTAQILIGVGALLTLVAVITRRRQRAIEAAEDAEDE